VYKLAPAPKGTKAPAPDKKEEAAKAADPFTAYEKERLAYYEEEARLEEEYKKSEAAVEKAAAELAKLFNP